MSLPGIETPGVRRWQTYWERTDPTMRRFGPSKLDESDLGDWMKALDTEIRSAPGPVMLVAHSLACLLVVHSAGTRGAAALDRVRGAFLVAVPDPAGPPFPKVEARSYATMPTAPLPLPFPCLIVASVDDSYATPDHVMHRAARWGAGLVTLGALGHLNGNSGLEEWPIGRALLDAFKAGARSYTSEAWKVP